MAEFGQEQAKQWLAALESGRLNAPGDVHDREGWNRFWLAHLDVGLMDQGFADMMSNDPELVPALRRRRARSVLLAGNGMSTESWALLLYGFEVTALDVSDIPRTVFRDAIADPASTLHSWPGLVVRAEDAVAIARDAVIPADRCPKMHRSERAPLQGGGSLVQVSGDLSDADACPGPFDVVIERRTVQLFPAAERSAALDRLLARLEPAGLLVSHQHAGGWNPSQPRTHFATDWAKERGLETALSPTAAMGRRTARLVFTTG